MKELKFKQKNGHGCGLYAIANALDFEAFITDERLDKSKTGVNCYELSKYLEEHGLDFYVDTVYHNAVSCGLPEWLKQGIISEPKGLIGIFLVSCQLSENGKLHMVSVRFDNSGKCTVFDSLRNEVVCLDYFHHIETLYHEVCGVYIFAKVHDSSWVFFNESYFNR